MDWIPPVFFIQTIEIDGFKSIQYMRESPNQPCTMVIGRNREAKSTWTEALAFVFYLGEPLVFRRSIRNGEEKFWIDEIQCTKRKYRDELHKLSIFPDWAIQSVKNNSSDWYCFAKMPEQLLARKLRELLRPKFLVANDGTSREKLRRMIWRISGLFTRGYQLLKGSEVVRAKVGPINWNAPWTDMIALVKMEDGTVKRPSALDDKELAIASLALIYGINAYLCSSFIVIEEIHRIYDRNDFLQKMEGLKKLATVCRGTQIIGTNAPPPARARGVHKIFFTH